MLHRMTKAEPPLHLHSKAGEYMTTKPYILIVEDDISISRFIKLSLESQNYECLEVKSAQEGLALTMSNNPDLILLDLGLPDMDGLELLPKIRELSVVKVIVLSARTFERDKVKALDIGADDYLTKPFSIAELLARVRVALRHQKQLTTNQHALNEIIRIRNLEIDPDRRLVTIDGDRIHLTPIEFQLLLILAESAGRVLTHKYIIEKVWGNSYDSETQSLRVFMASLRRKIEKDPSHPKYLLTEIGVGYRMVDE